MNPKNFFALFFKYQITMQSMGLKYSDYRAMNSKKKEELHASGDQRVLVLAPEEAGVLNNYHKELVNRYEKASKHARRLFRRTVSVSSNRPCVVCRAAAQRLGRTVTTKPPSTLLPSPLVRLMFLDTTGEGQVALVREAGGALPKVA